LAEALHTERERRSKSLANARHTTTEAGRRFLDALKA
jgi:hypothetical protein